MTRIAAIASCVLLLGCATVAPVDPTKPHGKIVLGLYSPDGCAGEAAFEKAAGVTLTIANGTYEGLTMVKGVATAQCEIAAKRTPMFSIGPSLDYQAGTVATMSDIAAGKYDALLTAMADQLHALGSPVYLRLFYEMCGDASMQKALPGCANNGPTFISAWIHVWGMFRDAPNVKFVWAPDDGMFPKGTAAKLYPGDQYVDAIGDDSYNKTTKGENFVASGCSFAAQHKKPFIVTETGAAGPFQKQWFLTALAACKTMYAVIPWDAKGNAQDYRIIDPAVMATVKAITQ